MTVTSIEYDNNSGLPELAPLKVISLARLLQYDPEESRRLFDACVKLGFFYLDLQGDGPQQVLRQAKDMFDTGRHFFDKPIEEKLQYWTAKYDPSELTGYKPAGTHAGVARGTKDGWEALKVSHDGLFGITNYELPPVIEENREIFERFMDASHSVCSALLSRLSDELNIVDPSSRLESIHRRDHSSNTNLALLKYPELSITGTKSIGQNAHTDIGSLTILFCDKWGLQVLMPNAKRWSYVAPLPGYAIINVGDTLTFLSGHSLRSNLHRVVPVPVLRDEPRYSMAYFLRPENKMKVVDAEGRVWTAQQWNERKIAIYKENHARQQMDSTVTGAVNQSSSMYWEGFAAEEETLLVG